jgi:hypothetical protein
VLALGKEADSTSVTIKDDPRLNKTDDAKRAQRTALDRLRKSADRLIEAIDRMAESEETLSKMTVQLRGLEGRENDSLRKMTVAMQDSIKAIRDYISGKTSDKQGLITSAGSNRNNPYANSAAIYFF